MALKKKTKGPNDFEPIVVNGCLIEPHTTYEVVPKDPTADAPKAYHDLGSTKERFPGVGNSFSLSQTDTGFYPASPVFNNNPTLKNNWELREETAEAYFQIFAEPLKYVIPDIERIKVPTDNEFFDANYENGYFNSQVFEARQYNTANPRDRFELYMAIIEGEICMKGKREDDEKEIGLKDEGDNYNKEAQYSYISLNKKKSREEQTAEMEMEVAYQFGKLVKEDVPTLVSILNYINIPTLKTISKSELNVLYKRAVEGNKEKTKALYNAITYYQESPEVFRKELSILEALATKKGREVITKHGNTYLLGDTPLGSNPKSVASSLIKNEELYNTFKTRLENIE